MTASPCGIKKRSAARTQREIEPAPAFDPDASDFIELGTVKQKGGKTVHAWAFEGDLPAGFVVASNTFAMEWPPRSGRTQDFPEIDRAEFFPIEEAKQKINQAQIELLDRLVEHFKTR